MTTPAHEAPFVLPAVAFRPAVLSGVCAGIAAAMIGAAAFAGYVMFGVFFAVGLALGLLNALMVRRAVQKITAKDHPLKSQMALNSAGRLLAITAIGLALAYIFRPEGLGVLFGLALFQVILVLTTSIPVWKKLRAGDDGAPDMSPTTATGQDK